MAEQVRGGRLTDASCRQKDHRFKGFAGDPLDRRWIVVLDHQSVTSALVFSVWRFPTDTGAQRALHPLAWANGDLLDIADAAVVSWPRDQHRPAAWQATELESGRAFEGAFWGMLIGLLFLLPLFDSVGELDRPTPVAAVPSTEDSLLGLGFDARAIASIRTSIKPGTSALFLYDRSADPAALRRSMPAVAQEVANKPLTITQATKLQAVFGLLSVSN